MIYRLDRITANVLDNIVALVHRLFDQGVAAESAYDVQARNVGFVLGAHLWNSIGLVTGELDATGLDE